MILRYKMKYIVGLMASTAVLLSSGNVSAATMVVDESTVMGGDFGNVFNQATVLASGVDGVTGSVGDSMTADIFDAFTFTGLATGIQTFEYLLNAPFGEQLPVFDLDFAENGFLPLVKITPVAIGEIGEFTTSASFNGTLTAIFSTNSSVVGDYSLNLQPSAVPVPAAVWLFASGLGVLGAANVRRKIKLPNGNI